VPQNKLFNFNGMQALDALTDNGFIKPAGRSRRNTNDYSIIVEKVEEFQWSKRGNFDGRNDDISTVENKPSFNHQLTTLPFQKTKRRTNSARRLKWM
jgi:hypothetical protein